MTEALGWISSASFGALVLLKSTLLLAAVFVAGVLLRRASASTQHYLWTLAYVALLALPVLSYVAQGSAALRISVPILEAGQAPEPPPAHSLDTSSSVSRPAPSMTRVEGPRSSSRAWPTVWQSVWILGAVVFIGRLIIGVVASRRVRHQAEAVEDVSWLDLLGDAQARVGTVTDVELRTSATSELPMTVGVRHPTILLPRAARDYSHQRRWAVLLHELAHVRRRDCLTQLIAQTACAVFWWHPLAWIGARHMRALSERASDDLVLDAGAKPSDYAHDLLDMARGLNLVGASAPIASVTMAHRSRLEDRLLAILDPAIPRRAATPRIKLPAAVLGLGMLVSVALAVPTVATSVLSQEPAQTRTAEHDSENEDVEDGERVVLSEAQEKARQALAEALDDPNASVREQALSALVRLNDERTVPHLVAALESADAHARADAAWGLGKMRHAPAADALIAALSDENDNVREQSAWSLGMLRSDRAVDALGVTVMSDSSANARSQAAWALGMIRNNQSVDALVAAILDDNEDVRSQAVWALGMIRDTRALPGLSKALQDDDVDVREQAIWAIGMLRSSESLDILMMALGDASADVREQAAWALGQPRDGRAVSALTDALEDSDDDVREQAAWALGMIANNGDDDIDIDLDLDVDISGDIDPDAEPEDDDPVDDDPRNEI